MKNSIKNVLLTTLISTIFIMCLFKVNASAAIWDGSTEKSFAGGKGTASNPYKIATPSQLAYLAQVVNSGSKDASNNNELYSKLCYQLTANIQLNDTSSVTSWTYNTKGLNSWNPIGIGGEDEGFCGTFDGAGHSISGLYISSKTQDNFIAGLFGAGMNCTIKNVGIKNGYIYSDTLGGYTAGILAYGVCCNIRTCFNFARISIDADYQYAGGLSACLFSSSIINSYNAGSVYTSKRGDTLLVGGLVGCIYDYDIRHFWDYPDITKRQTVVSNCYNRANMIINSEASKKYSAPICGAIASDEDALGIVFCNTYFIKNKNVCKDYKSITGTVEAKNIKKIEYTRVGYTESASAKLVATNGTKIMTGDTSLTSTLNNHRGNYVMWTKISDVNGGYPIPVYTTRPSTVTGLKASRNNYNRINLTWNAVAGAYGYQIYRRAASASGTYSLVGTTTNTKYTNTSLTSGKTYYYKVKAYKKFYSANITSQSYSKAVNVTPIPATPSVSLKTSKKSVTASWSKVEGASGYEYWYATSSNGTYVKIASVSNKTFSYTKTNLTANKKYYFKVRAYRIVNNKKVYGICNSPKSIVVKR